jgi:ATP-dependent Clp protease ATP-binding subunit ClpX
MDITLELDDVAAAMIAEAAETNIRTGARALRTVFNKIVNRLEFDPWQHEGLEARPEGGHRLKITPEMAKRAIGGNGG